MRKCISEWDSGILVSKNFSRMVETPLIYATFITQHCYSTCHIFWKFQKILQFKNRFVHTPRSSKTNSPTYLSRKPFNLWSSSTFYFCRRFVLGASFSISLFRVLFVCKCVLYYCHWLSTQFQLTNMSNINSNSPYSENSPSIRP